MKRITVLLADDHAIVREGLRLLLELHDDFEVVGEASTGREAVELATRLRPDVLVMDIAMPSLNGLEATRQILLKNPAARILILSAHDDGEYLEHALEAGVAGFQVKTSPGERLLHAIREIARGRVFFDPPIMKRIQEEKRKAREQGRKSTGERRRLTTREAEVLQRVAEGAPNKGIAAELGISIKTVEKHRQKLMDKLGIHETAGLTRYAISTGVIESSTQVTSG